MTVEKERLSFDRNKWSKESAQKDRELALQEAAQKSGVWGNPLALAIIAAAIAGGSNAGVAWWNARAQIALEDRKSDAQIALEDRKAEAARILQMISDADQREVRLNLEFLLLTGLVKKDQELTSDLQKFLDDVGDDQLPSRTSGTILRDLTPLYEGGPNRGQIASALSNALATGSKLQSIGYGHLLEGDGHPTIVSFTLDGKMYSLQLDARTFWEASASDKQRLMREAMDRAEACGDAPECIDRVGASPLRRVRPGRSLNP